MVVGAFDIGLAVAGGDDRGGDRQRVEIALADGLEDRDAAAARLSGETSAWRAVSSIDAFLCLRVPAACMAGGIKEQG